MSDIFESCNRGDNILNSIILKQIFPLPQLRQSVIISNRNCINELCNELPNDQRYF